MALEQTWRWFGPKDPYTLKEIKQTGATGIVTALHQIPVGEIWSIDEIMKRKKMITDEGMTWSVVESVPVHEDIKKRKNNYKTYIENYKKTIRNLAYCEITTVCYNFMPVLDWSRTNLKVEYFDGAITTKFDANIFTAFDLFILKREGAENCYSPEQIKKAKEVFDSMTRQEINSLTDTILLGLPGSLEALTIDEFKNALNEYAEINEEQLRENLFHFIKEVVPVAKEAGVLMAIHPDDPPWSLLGLPRVVGSKEDVKKILGVIDSPSNGLTLCTGSFGAGYKNDLVDITKTFADRINFIHLRNLTRNADGDFMEAYHLDGDIDLYEVMKALLLEQKRRAESGRNDTKMPMRPDHGHLMIPEMEKEGIYPGYSLLGRMRGLSELRGLQLGIIKSLGI